MAQCYDWILPPVGEGPVFGLTAGGYPYIDKLLGPSFSSGQPFFPQFWTTLYPTGANNIGPLGDNEVRCYNQLMLSSIFMALFFDSYGVQFQPPQSATGGGGNVLVPKSTGTLA